MFQLLKPLNHAQNFPQSALIFSRKSIGEAIPRESYQWLRKILCLVL